MNSLPKLRVLLLASLTLATGAFAEDVSDLLTDAQRTYFRGDIAAAKEKFNLVRKLDPANRTAQGFLRRIVADEAAQQTGKLAPNATETALKKIILEKVDFHDATLVELLDFLKQKGNQLGDGKVAINFVIQLDEQAKGARVTLSMQKVPFTEVLRYIGDLANVQFTFDPYAIVVKPKGAAATAGTANTPAPQNEPAIKGLQ